MHQQAPPDFAAAARRHFADAELLHVQQRLASADHLAGIAAECALKAILIDHMNGYLNSRNRPDHPNRDSSHRYSHLPDLWDEIALVAQGRAWNQLTTIFVTNPFERWNVAERYSDGNHITAQRSAEHLTAARTIIDLHHQATTYGVI